MDQRRLSGVSTRRHAPATGRSAPVSRAGMKPHGRRRGVDARRSAAISSHASGDDGDDDRRGRADPHACDAGLR